MSTAPEPSSWSPSRRSGLWCAWAMTVSTWPSSRIRRVPFPRTRASRSGAWSGEEHGGRSTSASAGSSAAQTAAHSSAPWTSPDGEDTATSASSSRSARRAIASASRWTQGIHACPGTLEWDAVPELPEMEIAARRLAAVLPGETIESALAPGINALKTFDPPLHALEGRAFTGVSRRGKLLMLELDDLVVLLHLMSAGPDPAARRSARRCATGRRGCCSGCPGDRELRVREFGTKQAAWVKVLRAEDVAGDESLAGLGPGGVAGPAAAARAARRAAAAALAAARPAGHHRDRPHLGRRDPQRRAALAVQARRRPRRRGGRGAARRDGRPSSAA